MKANMKIALFVAVFCFIVAIPFVAGAAAQPLVTPSLDTPEINALDTKQCIEPAGYMKSSHMKVLDQWRSEVVRQGSMEYVSGSGQVYEKSIGETCLRCHSNPQDFCDACHSNSGIVPVCWDCHEKSAAVLHGGENAGEAAVGRDGSRL